MFVDWERISLLADPNDPEEQVWLQDTIQELVLDLNNKMENLSSLLNQKKVEDLQSSLHQMKGVAANFGFELLAKQTSQAEDFFRTSQFEKGAELVLQLKTTWENTKQELKTKFTL